MEACRLGAYRAAHRLSDARRHVRAELAVREALVRARTRYIALAKALVRRDGLRVANSEAHLVARRIAALPLSDCLTAELHPLFEILTPLNAQIAAADQRIAALTAADPIVASPPGVMGTRCVRRLPLRLAVIRRIVAADAPSIFPKQL